MWVSQNTKKLLQRIFLFYIKKNIIIFSQKIKNIRFFREGEVVWCGCASNKKVKTNMADRMEKASEPRATTEANNNERKQICLAPFSLEKKDLLVGQKGFLEPAVALAVAKLEGQGVSQEEKDTIDEQRVSLEAVSLEPVDSREMVELEETATSLELARCVEPLVSVEVSRQKEPKVFKKLARLKKPAGT